MLSNYYNKVINLDYFQIRVVIQVNYYRIVMIEIT